MPVIAIVSPCGGAGRSTLTAQLATLAARAGLWSLAIEWDPQNSLALHFGAARPPAHGLATRAERGQPWHTAALQSDDGTLALPFGHMDAATHARWTARMAAQPDALSQWLAEIERPGDGWLFIDTPSWPSVYARQAVRAADLALAVLRADALSVALLDATIDASGDKALLAVLNQFDASRAMQPDMRAAMQERLGECLAPYPIHRDEALPECFAKQTALPDHAPHAQATHDMHGLLRWLRRLLDGAINTGSDDDEA